MPAYIYCIKNNVNGLCYIGQTINYNARSQKHFSTLRKGNHHNSHLQNAFNKYGEENFEISILEYVENDELVGVKEIQWIDEIGYYNIDKGNSKINEEGRKNMSESHMGIKSSKRIFTRKQVLYILAIHSFCDNSTRPLSIILECSRDAIRGIVKGITYKEIVDFYNKLFLSQKLLLLLQAMKIFNYDFWICNMSGSCPKKNSYIVFLYENINLSATELGNQIRMKKDGLLKTIWGVRDGKREIDTTYTSKEMLQILQVLCRNNTVLSSLLERKSVEVN